MKLIKSVVLGLMRGYGRGQMSERRRSHFFLFPFFFFLLFFDFLRPPGITGLIAGGLVGDGFGGKAGEETKLKSAIARGLRAFALDN